MENFNSKKFSYFFSCNKKPKVFKEAIVNWRACSEWSFDYFSQHHANLAFVAKYFNDTEVQPSTMNMREFVEKTCLHNGNVPRKRVPYCYELPIFKIAPILSDDIDKEFMNIIPNWYSERFEFFSKLFMSAEGSEVPLRFEELMTHNFFFQIKGKKRFHCINYRHSKLCERNGWNWFYNNLFKKNERERLMAKGVSITTFEVDSGDMFYMPPALLYQTKSLKDSISLSMNFHTIKSVMYSLRNEFRLAPIQNRVFNELAAKALLYGDQFDDYFQQLESYLT